MVVPILFFRGIIFDRGIMNKIVNKSTAGNGKHRGVVPSGSSGVWVFDTSGKKRALLSIANPDGNTFDIVHTNFTEEEDADDGMTSIISVDKAGITDTDYSQVSEVGVVSVGIKLGTASTADIIVEIIEID